MTQRTRTKSANRNGNLLIVALVSLAIATSLMFGALRTGLQARRQMRQQFQLEQTRWLLDAGVRHAHQMLRDDPDYDGETLTFDKTLPHEHSAVLTIDVDRQAKDADTAASFSVSSKLFRTDSPDRVVRRSETFPLTLHDGTQP